ncbi:MAG: phytanoyl-CoA dioxygenase family protein [Leadbetterella sp.]
MNTGFKLSEQQIADYQRDGYVIVKNLFNKVEIEKLYQVAIDDINQNKGAADLADQSGKKTRLSLWFNPGDDIYGLLTRSERMVNSVGQLMEGEGVAHYHSKLMQKEPHVGGAWEWHQDYGYWYKNQFMFPNKLISVMIAITEATKANGCLQVIKGSHKIGRVNHGFSGEQMGADMVMVENCLKTMELVYVEIEPGDALYFHANLLHRSAANTSDTPRWSLISCYNNLDTLAYNEKTESYRTPINVVPDTAMMEREAFGFDESNHIYSKDQDPALQKSGWEN